MKFKSLVFLFFLLFTTNCRDIIEEKCTKACGLYTKCTRESLGANAISMIMDRVEIKCMDICTRDQIFLGCYEDDSTSCKKYAKCILHSGLLE